MNSNIHPHAGRFHAERLINREGLQRLRLNHVVSDDTALGEYLERASQQPAPVPRQAMSSPSRANLGRRRHGRGVVAARLG
jgi:hypothetical protein